MTTAPLFSHSPPAVLQTVEKLRHFVKVARARGGRIALVPTMGALHDGHMELVRRGQKKAQAVIVSVFVNPAQFGPGEDYDAYPRAWDSDIEKLTAAGAQAVFAPSVSEMYPDGFTASVSIGGVAEPLEGERRPGHFNGVALVVTKMLLQTMPDVALFGEKDWQQLQVIRGVAADLNIPVEIEGVPTVRDENGLALSSRNAYLSPAQYHVAIRLNKILFSMAEKLRAGGSLQAALYGGHVEIAKAGFDSMDYLEIRDARTLRQASTKTEGLRILAAVRLGKARLIDNVGV
ncbi:MAG: pantoate--beta-alanine ligase [Proteobacteria bacterium]|nr:pantoate--beta-alanine ligase [Pseudomonadota bacterium]